MLPNSASAPVAASASERKRRRAQGYERERQQRHPLALRVNACAPARTPANTTGTAEIVASASSTHATIVADGASQNSSVAPDESREREREQPALDGCA